MLRTENGTREQNQDSIRDWLFSFHAWELLGELGVPFSVSLICLPERFSARLSGQRTN